MDDVLGRPVQYLKGVGEIRAARFGKRGIQTVDDLLHLYPRTYEDWATVCTIAQAALNHTVCCVRVTALCESSSRVIRKGLTLFSFAVSDGIDRMTVTLFNTRFQAEAIRRGERYLLYGKVTDRMGYYEMSSPAIALAQGGERIRPVYLQSAGLPSSAIEKAMRSALDLAGDALRDFLPPDIRRRNGLLSIKEAMRQIHFPDFFENLQAARDRLVFEELLILQLGLFRLKNRRRRSTGVRITRDFTEEFRERLPFTPTEAQNRAIAACVRDLRGPLPMNRLIQGDVGSGKTAVAAAAAYIVIRNGWQAAIMVPTDILARQHALSLSRLLGNSVRVGLLTGSLKAAQKRQTLQDIAEGKIDLVIGTHALISGKTVFHRLGLVITDEQHRFGVEQRVALSEKGEIPHRLVMSATPIPRTLALMMYGDLDISVLDELPPGRMPVATYAVGPDKRERVFHYIEKFLRAGKQGFIVCPLVEEDEDSASKALAAATEYAVSLRKGPLGAFRIGLMHGRMKGEQKEKVMLDFAAHRLDLLVCTTVVEVGVDVPNACIMVVENAERFGLAQLHQLRGRVGRGSDPSGCVLISGSESGETRRRLQVMCRTNDGFQIAQEDLKLRGPGDFFGDRQHGLPPLDIADLKADMRMLQAAQEEALRLNREDPDLIRRENAPLRQKISRLFAQVGEEGLN